MARDLEGKSIVVTGGGTGIGRAAALACSAAGARVVVADIGADAGRQTVSAIHELGGEAIFVETDVSSETQVTAMVEAAVMSFGKLDGALNNAGLAQTNLPAPRTLGAEVAPYSECELRRRVLLHEA